MSGLTGHSFMAHLGIGLPVIQAPMAGVSTPALAASVSEAGGLGFLGIGASDVAVARQAIREVRARTARPFGVNLFCHQPASRDAVREGQWVARLAPEFARYGGTPPAALAEIYQSFLTDVGMLQMLLTERPPVVSFHFGLPSTNIIAALRDAGIVLVASATSLAEAQSVQTAGLDAVVAQGYEAGGHRGIFDADGRDDRMGVFALTRVLVDMLDIPVIAAGGIMDGSGIAAVLRLGAIAAQLGTAYIACPESAADAGYRAALFSEAAHHTIMTRVISGRPARCLANRFAELGRDVAPRIVPAYPVAYDLGKALNGVAKRTGEFGYGAQWAGQGAPLARSMPAFDLTRLLITEASRV